LNTRSATRSCRPWAIAAACGLSLAVAAGCDKGKTDANAAPAGAPAPGGPAKGVGVVDPQRMITTLGWGAEMTKQRESVASDIGRELDVFQKALTKAVEEQRSKISTAARLNPDQADKLAKGVELDKLPITKEQRDEYVIVVNRSLQANQEAVQAANNQINKWAQEVQQMYTESAKPAVRRAAQASGTQVVLLAGTVFHYDTAVDLTDKVIDEMQKSPPQRNFPPTPRMNYPQVQLSDLSKAATQPIVPAAGGPSATKPAGK
jgi:Skp family chaperone for outer membrane proteins